MPGSGSIAGPGVNAGMLGAHEAERLGDEAPRRRLERADAHDGRFAPESSRTSASARRTPLRICSV